METAVDSNSESDISDSWAVIDDYSSLEWNNEISLGLGPPHCEFVKRGLPTFSPRSSKSELSDEDSIEVLAEDHIGLGLDNLSDQGAEEVQDEEGTGIDQLESKENICIGTCIPLYATHLKKINHKWRESNPILIAILVMGILGGLGLGFLWASHYYKPENLTSIQPTRALLIKLENEIKFLRRQLRSAQSSLKSAVSKPIQKLDYVTKQDLHVNTKEKHFEVVYPRMCSITDFMIKSPVLQNNFSKEYCLASERPRANENVWANSDDNVSVNIAHTSSSSKLSAIKNLLEVKTGVNNNKPNENTAQTIPYEYDAKQIDQTFQESSEKASFETIDSLQHVNTIEELLMSDVIASTSRTFADQEGKSDPRPYTKLRTTVERIYTILSVINNNIKMVLPSQVELLSILPQNIVALDLSKRHFATTVHDTVTSFTIQMQDTTQKLFDDIDSSVNSIVEHIAFKIKAIETFNKKHICNLKTSLESSADIALLLDLNREPIFQMCIQEEKQNYHGDLVKSKNKLEGKGPLTESKEIFMVSESITTSQKEPNDQSLLKDTKFIHHERKYQKENVQQSETQHLEFGETTSVFGDKKSSDLNKKSPKMIKNILENKIQLTESTDTSVHSKAVTYHNRKGKKDHYDKEIKPKIVKAAKSIKLAPKHSELHVIKNHEKSGVKKTFRNNENKHYNESHAKDQNNINPSSKRMVNTDRTSNVSGNWALKMANGRAEQRRRDHQSDWVFERAKSRMANRRKSIKESYSHNDRDYSNKFLNSNVCNKTMPFKDQASKSWKKVKQRMKNNFWKPLIDSAKSVKKAFNKFNNKIRYHSRQE